jgi:hypothetical protein
MSPRTLAGSILETINRFFIPPSLDPDERNRRLASGFAALIAAPVLYLYGTRNLINGNLINGFLELGTAVIYTVSFFLGKTQRQIETLIKVNLGWTGFLLLFLLLHSAIRWHEIFWLYLFPIAVFFLLGPFTGMLYNLIFLTGAAVVLFVLQGEILRREAS